MVRDPAKCNPWPHCGWWFGAFPTLDEDLTDDQELIDSNTQSDGERDSKEQEVSKDPCDNLVTWNEECGFVDPGNSFEFQAKQRDALYQRSVMNPRNPKAVEDFQYYLKWAVNQAILMARMGEFNYTQNVELNPAVRRPTSSFGIRMLANVRELRDEEIFQTIVEADGFLAWFTRSDCTYCHEMVRIVGEVSNRTKIPIWNLSLDTDCFDAFKDYCRTGDQAIQSAQQLKVEWVPALFLYIPDDSTWLRISTGVDSVNTIVNRIGHFFSAVRTAAANNVSNGLGTRPSVDFSKEQFFKEQGLGQGVDLSMDSN